MIQNSMLIIPKQVLKCAMSNLGFRERVPEVCRKLPVAGRLKHFLHNWEKLTQDQWVLQAVQGVQIELLGTPQQFKPPTQQVWAEPDQTLFLVEIKTMIEKGAIRELSRAETQNGFYSNMFLVPKKDGKMRPVINLKRLNTFVETHHFKMEGLQTARELIRPNNWLTKIDLKDAYFTIPICESHRKYLRFRAGQRAFQFTCLPFGLSSAPWIFTKTMRPVAAKLRELGIRLVIYLDDILVIANSQDQATDHTSTLIYTLENLGFIVHPEKSMTQPTQRVEFLGMIIDSRSMELQVPGQKIKSIRSDARKILHSRRASTRETSRLIGKMTSVAQAIPPAPLFYRTLQRDVSWALARSNQNYDAPCFISPKSSEELQWWIDHLTEWNGKSLMKGQTPDMTIESDASS